MKVNQPKQASYRKSSYRQNSKTSYYTPREEQKPSFNFIEESKLRIVQDNLVSVSGLSPDYDDPNLLADNQHFGKYGIVNKIITSTQGKHRSAFIQVYITYESNYEAALAIRAMDGIKIDGRQISATFGTTKYCSYFLKHIQCRNQKCFYLHQYETNNELTDGVKNNLDILDQKSEKIINSNLDYYIKREFEEAQQKQESDFPSVSQTIQYLLEENLIDTQLYRKIKKQVQTAKQKKVQQTQVKAIDEEKNRTQPVKQIKELIVDNENSPLKSQCYSNKSNQSQKRQQREEQMIQLTQMVKGMQLKNRKCNSLSTASSPAKYEKLDSIQQESIDRTIQRRIIKQIMRNNMVFRSRMDFVTQVPGYGKQQNNKMKNYLRRHLLNQI